jgi:hypothetical protein
MVKVEVEVEVEVVEVTLVEEKRGEGSTNGDDDEDSAKAREMPWCSQGGASCSPSTAGLFSTGPGLSQSLPGLSRMRCLKSQGETLRTEEKIKAGEIGPPTPTLLSLSLAPRAVAFHNNNGPLGSKRLWRGGEAARRRQSEGSYTQLPYILREGGFRGDRNGNVDKKDKNVWNDDFTFLASRE